MNRQSRRTREDAPKTEKISPVAATSDEEKGNHYEVDMSRHVRRRWPKHGRKKGGVSRHRRRHDQ
jgi:hypothetical protein